MNRNEYDPICIKTNVKKIIIYIILNSAVHFSFGQTLRQPVSAIYTHLNAYSSFHTDASSSSVNPASLASLKNISAGVYAERKFYLKELDQYRINAAMPLQNGKLGFQINHWGSGIFNESELSLAYARNMGKLDAGIQFNYYQIKTSGYGKASTINFDAGLIFHATERLRTGIHIYNPVRKDLNKTREKLPFIYSAAIGYDASNKVFIGGMIRKSENQPVNIQTGLQYCFDEKLIARMGISTGTTAFYFGAGFKIGLLRLDVTASLHQYLGITPSLLIIYTSKNK
jgi:hypothetical protein